MQPTAQWTSFRPSVLGLLLLATLPLGAQPKPDEDFDITISEVAGQRHYGQALRPQLHYTPIQGHIGDATGLIYYSGEYHLFYMYDQWSRRRLAHKQWGHAISRDLIHWEEMPPLLDKLLDNSPGSGSGVVDWNDSSGLRRGPEKTLVIFYTDYKRGTCILYSRDRGRTWTRHQANPVIAGAEDARDPTVFWYMPASEWRMIRYEKKGFAFYKSRNLTEWTWLSRLDGYYECPDLIELPVENMPGQRRWVLIDGNGSYQLGQFDGERFTPQTERMNAEYGKALYAPQTWKRTMEGGSPAIQVAWTRYPLTPRLTWNGQTSLPVELTLWSFPDGIRLCRKPTDDLNNLRISQRSWSDLAMGPGEKPIPEIKDDLLDLEVEIESQGKADFGLNVAGQQIRYSVADQSLRVGKVVAPLKLSGSTLRLRVVVDRSSMDVFADRGQVTVSTVLLDPQSGPKVSLVGDGKVRARSLKAYRLESMWTGHPAMASDSR